MPKLYIVSGCNGAGKTTASYTLLPEMLDCRQFVNSDEFAKGLSPFNPEGASIQASRYMLLRIRYLLQRGEDFGIETTLATRTLLKTVKIAQEAGYYVTVLYFWLNSPDLAVKRVKARVAAGGHNIPEETVRRRYRVGIGYFFHDYAPICDRWILEGAVQGCRRRRQGPSAEHQRHADIRDNQENSRSGSELRRDLI